MHKASKSLDSIIHKEEQNCIYNLTKLESLSDHCIIGQTMKKTPSQPEKIEKKSRNLKNINTDQFKINLKNKLEIMPENANTEEMYGNYINNITSIIEKHTSLSRRKLMQKQQKSWFDEEALKLKIQRRKVEKIWQKSKCELHKMQYLLVDKCYKRHLYYTKKKSLRDQLSSEKNKTKTLYKIPNTLTTDIRENTFPLLSSNKKLADIFANFFVERFNKIRSEFQHDESYNIPTRNCNTLSYFQP